VLSGRFVAVPGPIRPSATLEKLMALVSVALVRCANPWGTPWHTVVLADRDGYRLVKRAEAEQQNAVLVYRDGRPSHFALHDALVREMVA